METQRDPEVGTEGTEKILRDFKVGTEGTAITPRDPEIGTDGTDGTANTPRDTQGFCITVLQVMDMFMDIMSTVIGTLNNKRSYL